MLTKQDYFILILNKPLNSNDLKLSIDVHYLKTTFNILLEFNVNVYLFSKVFFYKLSELKATICFARVLKSKILKFLANSTYLLNYIYC